MPRLHTDGRGGGGQCPGNAPLTKWKEEHTVHAVFAPQPARRPCRRAAHRRHPRGPGLRGSAVNLARALSLRWWVCDQNGRLTLAQWPNPALTVWLVAVVVAWTGALGQDRTATLKAVGQGALVVWALDELVRGATPARRVLGAVVLAVQLVRLFA